MINLLEAFSVRYSPLETAVDLIFQALVQPNLLKIRFKFPLSGHLRVSSFILLFVFNFPPLLLAQTVNPQPLEGTFNHLKPFTSWRTTHIHLAFELFWSESLFRKYQCKANNFQSWSCRFLHQLWTEVGFANFEALLCVRAIFHTKRCVSNPCNASSCVFVLSRSWV